MTFPDDYLIPGIEPYHVEEAGIIYCGDCRDILPHLPKVDLVLTDPPYEAIKEDWDILDIVWFSLLKGKTDLLLFTPGIWNIWKYPPADWILCWVKQGSTRRNATGGFNHWEPVLQYGKSKKMVDTILLPDCANHDFGNKHPCPKPLKLFSWLIKETVADIILDPFLGSGTTAVAAKELGRKFIGIEISEEYCAIAKKRLRQGVLDFG
jgi:DNA modification methylase